MKFRTLVCKASLRVAQELTSDGSRVPTGGQPRTEPYAFLCKPWPSKFRPLRTWVVTFLILMYSLVLCLSAWGTVQITEFMAINTVTTIDDDDDRSDWIEIYNPTDAPVNLDGWYLVDSTDHWRFPEVVLSPQSYLVVFASEKDRAVLGAPLHTNFRLSAEGEYLALSDPDQNAVSEFFPKFPPQRADVSYGRGTKGGAALIGYLLSPTPGMPNDIAFPGTVGAVGISEPSKTFVSPFTVELTLPNDAGVNAEIRYTMDRTVPTQSSSRYRVPLSIRSTTQVRARVFEPGVAVGPTVTEIYLGLEADVLDFTSDIPLIILDNFGLGTIPQDPLQPAVMMIFEPGKGRSSLTATPTLTTRIGMKVRGSSTALRPKPSLTVEAWAETNEEDKNISPLGMPAESDWVLWGPYNFDLALMRNPFIYELSNQVGQYAVRTRYVEIFLNTGGGRISYADYWGVYSLMEKISRDEDRVDVERLFPEHDREPGVTGGYMLKIDRLDPGDSGFSAAGQSLCYVYPKEIDIERPERNAQEQYIRGFMNEFGAALSSANYRDPVLGYAGYLDVDAAIDHHILNVLSKNADAFRLSTYMYKPRGGKLTFGPVWDFDRSMESTDSRDDSPITWQGGTDFFNYPWWERMFTDANFFQRYIDRWFELRKHQLSAENMHAIIDAMADEIREAQVRDLQRWNQRPRAQYGGTFQGEVDMLKDWLATRADWMDSQFVLPPVFNQDGGYITPGFQLTMTGPPDGTIYFTRDGSDPLFPGGKISPSARVYREPIVLEDNTMVKARVKQTNSAPNPTSGVSTMSDWSGLAKAWFSVHAPARAGNLVITEVNFHPLDPTLDELMIDRDFLKEDFEFVELKNTGASTLDLVGVRFTDGITFSFAEGSVATLAPGELVVVVENPVAFTARYGPISNVAGYYTGNLDNGGEHLRLEDAEGSTILDFIYEDDWYPLTDGFGFSLTILNESAPPDAWGSEASWRMSTNVGGSPGEDDPLPADIPAVLVNEALTNTDLPTKDAIELYNPSESPADISGWYLTDDRSLPQKYRIPPGTVIEPGRYDVFDEDDFNPALPLANIGFSLSSLGEEVYLLSADGSGNLTGYFHGFRFGAAENGISFGRHVISTGEEHFVAQTDSSLNEDNAGPRVGSVVVNEIMYNPSLPGRADNTRDEYLELWNISAESVPLYDPNNPTNPWHIEGGVYYTFPANEVLPPGGYLLVVGFNPETDLKGLTAFRLSYDLDTSIRIVGPYVGTLGNSGERLSLLKPDSPLVPPHPDAGLVPYVLVDEVNYSNSHPWATGAVGGDNSLQRLNGTEYGDDPVNWQAAAATPGQENVGGSIRDTDGDGLPDEWENANGLNPNVGTGDDGASGDPDGDGSTNLQEYLSGTHPRDAASFLRVDSIDQNTTAVIVRFTAVAGKTYTILYRDTLDSGEWQKLTDVVAQPITGDIEIPDPGASSTRTRYYRLVTPQLP